MPIPYNTLLAIRWSFRQTGRKLVPAPKPEIPEGSPREPTPFQKEMLRCLCQAEEDCEMGVQEYRHFSMVIPMTFYSRPITTTDEFWTQCRECLTHFYTKKSRREHAKKALCVPKIEAYYTLRKENGRCAICSSVTKDKFLGFPLCRLCLFGFKTTTRLAPNYQHYSR